jgi:putative lipoic acid-binding regulatory protein
MGTSKFNPRGLDKIHAENPGQGFQFPGAFEITAVGNANTGLERCVPEIIADLGMAVLSGSERVRPSSAGNFISVSVTFTCPSREMYETAHAALRENPAVKWTL